MCVFGGGPKAPSIPAPPAAPAALPTEASAGVKKARGDKKRQIAALQGSQATFLTGSRGLLAPEQTAGTTLLGGGGAVA